MAAEFVAENMVSKYKSLLTHLEIHESLLTIVCSVVKINQVTQAKFAEAFYLVKEQLKMGGIWLVNVKQQKQMQIFYSLLKHFYLTSNCCSQSEISTF